MSQSEDLPHVSYMRLHSVWSGIVIVNHVLFAWFLLSIFARLVADVVSHEPSFLHGKECEKMKSFIGLVCVIMLLAACTGQNTEPADGPGVLHQEAGNQTRPTTDREGFAISVPDEINRIIAIGASNAEIIVALGLGNKIVAVDMWSADVQGLPAHASTALDMLNLNAEFVVSLMPDIIFVTGMARAGGTDDPLAPVSSAGITIIYMPTSTSIDAIMEDILFIAAVVDRFEAGEAIVLDMQAEINEIREIAAGIDISRTVYFEIDHSWMISFGHGTFLNEMIELVGATNIFGDMEGWFAVSAEDLLMLNPDVILTSSDFLDDPISEIAGRPGFDALLAVQNGNIHLITANYSNRPSHNITLALREIAMAVFPEYFRED